MKDRQPEINKTIESQVLPGVFKFENVPVDDSIALRQLEILRNSLPPNERDIVRKIISKNFSKRKVK